MKTIIVTTLIFFSNIVVGQNLDQDFDSLVRSADNAFNNQNYEKAILLYNEVIWHAPDAISNESHYFNKDYKRYEFALAFFRKSKSKAFLGNLIEGYIDLDAAEKTNPKIHLISFFKELYKTSFFDDEIDETVFLEDFKHQQIFVERTLASAQIDFGYFKEAHAIYASLLTKNKTPLTYFHMGRLLEILGKKKKAKLHLQKGYKLLFDEKYSNSGYNFLKIRYLQVFGKPEEANNLIQKATLEDSENIYLLYLKAKNYFNKKEYELAINIYNKIVNEDPYYRSALVNLAVCYYQKGNTEKGINMLDELLVERPNYYWALCERAKINLELEKFETAEKDIDKALKLKPNHPLAYKLKGDLKLLQDQKRNACFYYQAAEEKYYSGFYSNDATFQNKIKLACPK